MERLLQMVPMITDPALEGTLTELKTKEKAKPVKDFDKINIIEEFLDMRAKYIQNKKVERGGPARDAAEEEDGERRIEADFYELLTERIAQNMARRVEHESIIDRNNGMIRELRERAQHLELKQKQLVAAVSQVRSNAQTGQGSEVLCRGKGDGDDKYQDIWSGRLATLSRDAGGGKGKGGGASDAKAEKKDDEFQNADLGEYFEQMKKKESATMLNTRLQKMLDENKKRRNIMKAQFGQFSSFSAEQLLHDGVIDGIKIGTRKIDDIVKQCKYLFYEIKEDESGEQDGGYRVELSFEEKMGGWCGLGAVLPGGGQKQVGNNNQSILSTFVLTNETLAEMRRVMATKCTVNLGGTTFNIFRLVKLINTMKTKN